MPTDLIDLILAWSIFFLAIANTYLHTENALRMRNGRRVVRVVAVIASVWALVAYGLISFRFLEGALPLNLGRPAVLLLQTALLGFAIIERGQPK